MTSGQLPDIITDMSEKYTYVVSKTDDGTIQITFTYPFEVILTERTKVLEEEGKNLAVPGFRKGMAPIDKVIDQVPKDTLIQKTLSTILTESFTEAAKKDNLVFALYPKFELISVNENEPWQIRALTCNVPTLDLGDYKKAILDEKENLNRSVVTTSDQKDIKSEKKELNQNEKETLILNKIIETSNAKIPKMFIDEDVNHRLSNLLERIEKLGLNLENYLSSIGKTPDSIRKEYEKQSSDSITLEMALNKIADEEKIEIKEEQIEEAVKASSTDPVLAEELKKPEKRNLLASVLRRQEALKRLMPLI